MPTILDVARRAGVSRTTVSRVLNDQHLVNSRTRASVLKAIRELNYTPSILAQGMRYRKTRSFAVLIPDFTNLYYSELLNYIEVEARRRGYLAIMCTTEVDPEREKEYVGQLLRRRVDGLIFCWYRSASEEKAYLSVISRRVPVVLLDQPARGLAVTSVYTDGYSGMKQVTGYLIEKGHRKYAYLKSYDFCPAVKDRFRGFAAALKESGILFDKRLIGNCDFSINGGYNAAQDLFELGLGPPTAVVADDDLAAIGFIEYCKEYGIRVPGEIAVTGFDDIMISSFVSPRLTTVAQPIKKIAEVATEELIKRVENRDASYRVITFPPALVIRESSG